MPDTPVPTDRVRIVATDAATGEYFRLGTRSQPDKLIFTRSKTLSNAHELEMPAAEWERIQGTLEDLGLTAVGSHVWLQVHFIVDEAAHSGGEVIAQLRAELAEALQRHSDGVAALAKELDEARAQKPDGTVKASLLSAEETACLRERDALITLLMPFIEDKENDTPVGVLTRLIAKLNQPVVATPPLAYGVRFDPATFKASLPQDIAELRLLAEPLGIPVDGKNGQTLRKLITEAELAKRLQAA